MAALTSEPMRPAKAAITPEGTDNETVSLSALAAAADETESVS
jgi:hypothetical protein